MYYDTDEEIEFMLAEDTKFDKTLNLFKYDPDYQIIKDLIFKEYSYNLNFEDDYEKAYTGKYQRYTIAGIVLPSRTKTLEIGSEYNICLCGVDLPDTIENLILSGKFNQPLNCVKFPKNLQKLVLSGNYDQSLVGVKFPVNLKYIVLGSNYNQSLKNVIFPDSLIKIKFGNKINDNLLDLVLPSNVTHIVFSTKCVEKLHLIKLPSDLKIISFETTLIPYKDFLDNLPDNLEEIHIDKLDTKLLNLPCSLKKIKINYTYPKKYMETHIPLSEMIKIPFGRKVVDKYEKIVNIDNTFV